MPRIIREPALIPAEGGKRIEEFVGGIRSGDTSVSVARMVAPGGWQEPGQRPDFREVTLVLRGRLRVESEDGERNVSAGQAIVVDPGEWVRYSCPDEDGAEYVAICLPAFSPDTVNRDDDPA
ncbi:cupin domain-containing protein [bacterium]|nr:cupin domain-containing protein [bacterium]PIV81856.1 MAG: cupin [bacterium CG17_big_fil_post_rev_8_21_14_2_50_64_8]PJA75142.1 MAG: cupin [bacterium CG_4_9_14_3_um_filter_65_15]